jgi:hypothetical protein
VRAAKRSSGTPTKLGRRHIGGLQSVHYRAAMHGRTGIDQRVDRGETDGSAEIAHQVEKAAGVRQSTRIDVVERHPRRRQKAKHDGKAANQLRPKHRIETGLLRLRPTEPETYGE